MGQATFPSTTVSKSIFISHASADKSLVECFVDVVLGNACEVKAADIFCTSLEGMKIPVGTPSFIDFIRKQIQQPKLVILIISPNYLASQFCLCEMGACWGMELPVFPIVVPPLKPSEVKATLAVTLSASIQELSTLEELCDRVGQDVTGHSVSRARSTAKLKTFLTKLEPLLKSLPESSTVPRSELITTQAQIADATEQLAQQEAEIDKLTDQIAALEKVKDKVGVAKVRADFSNDAAELEHLIKDARVKIKVLKKATPYVLFCQLKNEPAHFGRTPSSEMIDASVNANEIYYDDPGFRLNFEKPKVADAGTAIEALEAFIDNDDHQAVVSSYAEENDMDLDLRDFDTWIKLFYVSDPT